jgi:hypothetical protein
LFPLLLFYIYQTALNNFWPSHQAKRDTNNPVCLFLVFLTVT